MSWTLVREFGIEYSLSSIGSIAAPLSQPVSVERSVHNTYLIVDELSFGKYLSVAVECRTRHVDQQGEVLYDSKADGFYDCYGVFIGNSDIALLLRSRWEVVVIGAGGNVKQRIDLSTISKGFPQRIARTWKGTFLVSFFTRKGQIDLVEIDIAGRLLWFLPQGSQAVGFVGSIQLLRSDRLLFTDELYHVAREVDRDGRTMWEFGRNDGFPSDEGNLANPKSALETWDGLRLIADTRNHRVLEIGGLNGIEEVRVNDGAFCSPSFADVTPEGHYLVCDAGNGRVVEFDSNGHTIWQYGRAIGVNRLFSFPRSVEYDGRGEYLVADTGNNRISRISRGKSRSNLQGEGRHLFWPRCARRSSKGGLLIADGRNSRVIEVSEGGALRNELACFRFSGDVALEDPHDVRELENGNLLIVDSPRNLVVECDWEGRVSWSFGGEGDATLNDPHSAQKLASGEVLISDTWNNRVLLVDDKGRISSKIEAVWGASFGYRLSRPRYAEIAPDGTLVIADSDNGRILAASLHGELIWKLSTVPQSPLSTFIQPRWVQAIGRGEVVVCDHHHHRVLHLRNTASNCTAF